MLLEIKQIFKTLDFYSEPTVIGHQESFLYPMQLIASSY